jgi:hypothetical protein
MNDKRRASLQEASQLLGRAAVIIERVSDDEQDAMDNYPENLQSTEKFEAMESAVDNLNDAVEKISEAKEHIDSAKQ